MEIKDTTTNRGFRLLEFIDRYGCKCSIQESSLATEDAIWFGVSNPNPQIMASQAKEFGIETSETCGWIEYPIPDEVLIHTRMHLTREQVKELLPILQLFVEEGELPDA